ncbi:hypothetical protein [Desulfomicrobium orale]|uniref:Uncharacterized protein n=1 Tax=Desulfomicrobium orale DSM 12838 TaxID=888061 RepID=A0A120KND2_9BACT|nr:hypothetical protein [Desulfomicrobium orale]AMD93826.1 hypothetical protein AXF15_12430 [Desulfomicrobium orale DSM 12838]
MDQTGFPADTIILSLSAADWRHRQELEQSNVFEKYTKGLKKTLLVLKDLQKSDDIDLLVKVEASLISMERSLYAKNDPSVLPSLNAAVRDFEDIKKAVDVVKSPKAYIAAANTYRSNKKIHGVVIDGCHEAINGHVTRLGNRMSAVGISIPEKNILRQRQENMRQAKKLYMDLQRKALGLPLETDRGLER